MLLTSFFKLDPSGAHQIRRQVTNIFNNHPDMNTEPINIMHTFCCETILYRPCNLWHVWKGATKPGLLAGKIWTQLNWSTTEIWYFMEVALSDFFFINFCLEEMRHISKPVQLLLVKLLTFFVGIIKQNVIFPLWQV